MEKKLTNSIQNDFLKITGVKISKIYIKNKILPVFRYLDESKKNMFLLSGSQGIGKTTFIKILYKNFNKYYKKKILTLSLDDFYYSKNYRKKLSKLIHPLMATRGVPGTHNIKLLLKIINNFEKNRYPIEIPIFDKLNDNRIKKKRIINYKHDILILEGWCCGSPPIKNYYLYKNINKLEKEYDKKFIWRNYYNKLLKNDYSKIFKKFDLLIYFKTHSFSYVKNWRLNQENQMKKKMSKSKLSMNKKQIIFFISHYEKLTKWMMKKLHHKANLTLFIDDKQKIKKISNV